MLNVIDADWPFTDGLVAFTTTRIGGCSVSPYDSFNLATHVEDDPAAVAANRDQLLARLGIQTPIGWLDQVHGSRVVEASGMAEPAEPADAVVSRTRGVPCAVLTADCLPVLLCSAAGDVVAAAHAGWRGLAAGVLESTVCAMDCAPEAVFAWMGPAIGARAFEVGPEVRESFLAGADKWERARVNHCFHPSERAGHFYADLYGLARQRLAEVGVTRVSGGNHCTYTDAKRFFSYRRDGRTGRMASLIMLT